MISFFAFGYIQVDVDSSIEDFFDPLDPLIDFTERLSRSRICAAGLVATLQIEVNSSEHIVNLMDQPRSQFVVQLIGGALEYDTGIWIFIVQLGKKQELEAIKADKLFNQIVFEYLEIIIEHGDRRVSKTKMLREPRMPQRTWGFAKELGYRWPTHAPDLWRWWD